jgi:hypothetical protein
VSEVYILGASGGIVRGLIRRASSDVRSSEVSEVRGIIGSTCTNTHSKYALRICLL